MKSVVSIITNSDERYYHNDYTNKFFLNMNGWIASSSANSRQQYPSSAYLAVGTGVSKTTGNALEHECIRLPITASFVEPVSARSRILLNLQLGDMTSIPWGELGLFDSADFSIVLNRCDVLGKWTSDHAIKLYTSTDNFVQDTGALFGEFDALGTSNLFSTVDLADGANDKISGATSNTVNPYFSSYVTYDGVSTYKRITSGTINVGRDSTTTDKLYNHAALEFNLASLPNDCVITSVKLGATSTYVSTAGSSIDVFPYHGNVENTPTTDTESNQYSFSYPSSGAYVTATSNFNQLGTSEIDLGATALTDIKTSFGASKIFSLGVVADNDNNFTTLENPYISVTYTRSTSLGVNASKFGLLGDYLQFFLFVADTTIFTNDSIYVKLSSSETASTDEWAWTLNTVGLNDGWNAVQVPLGESVKTGSPNVSYIKRFNLSVDGTSEPTIVGIDNIRLFRPSGNLMNRVVINDNFIKEVGTSATIQWIIDINTGV